MLTPDSGSRPHSEAMRLRQAKLQMRMFHSAIANRPQPAHKLSALVAPAV